MKHRLAAASAAAIFVVSGLSGCSQKGPEAGTGPGDGNSWTVHGVLRWAGVAEPDNMNPVVGNQQIESDLAMFWGGFLFNWSDQNELVPELAAQVPTLANGGIAKDGLSITYHLRKGVTWQDGAPFTADDVIYTYQQVINPNNFVASTVGYDSNYITRIDKKDDYTIVVRLAKPWAPFVNNFLALGSTPYCVLPKHLLSKYPNINKVPFNNKPVGTGPFQVVEYDKGSLIKMIANPHYWRGAPKLKEIDYRIIPDENTILTQLESHEIDFEYYAPASQAPELGNLTGYRIFLTPFTQYNQLSFNTKSPMLADVRVRQALYYATDRRTLIHNVSHDVYVPGDSDQPPFLWAYNRDVKKYPFDLAKAGKLLDQAGWSMGADGYRHKNGQTLELTMSGTVGRAEGKVEETVVQQQWKSAGVKVDIKDYVSPQFFASFGAGGILQTGKYDVAVYSWINGTDPDDSTLFMCDQFPPAGQNTYHYCNKELDRQEIIALTSFDPRVRKAAYDRIQEILAEDAPLIIVWYVQRQDVANTDLKNYKPAHAVTTFWNPWEWEI